MSKKKKRNEYLNNRDIYIEICFWKLKMYAFEDMSIKLSDKLGEAVRLTTEGLAKHPNYVGYTWNWKEEMIANGIESMIKGLFNFNEQKYKNVHGYMSKAAEYAFLQTMEKEDKELLATYSLFFDNHRDFNPRENIDEQFVQDMVDRVTSIEDSIDRKKQRRKLLKIKRELSPLAELVYGDDITEKIDREIKKTETFYNKIKIKYETRGRILLSVDRIKEGLGIELGSICVGDVIEYLKENRQMNIDENMRLGKMFVDITFMKIDNQEFVEINWE